MGWRRLKAAEQIRLQKEPYHEALMTIACGIAVFATRSTRL